MQNSNPWNTVKQTSETHKRSLRSSPRLAPQWPGEALSCQRPREELWLLGERVTCTPPPPLLSPGGDQRAESGRWGQRAAFLPHYTLTSNTTPNSGPKCNTGNTESGISSTCLFQLWSNATVRGSFTSITGNKLWKGQRSQTQSLKHKVPGF